MSCEIIVAVFGSALPKELGAWGLRDVLEVCCSSGSKAFAKNVRHFGEP